MLSPRQILQRPTIDARRPARSVLPFCLLLLLNGGVRPAHADGLTTLDSAATRIAELVADKLNELKVKEVVVNTFFNTYDDKKPGGSGISEAIKDKLRRKGINCVRKSDYTLTGTFSVTDKATKQFKSGHTLKVPAAKIVFQLKQKDKQEPLLDSLEIEEDGLGIVEEHPDLAIIGGLNLAVDGKDAIEKALTQTTPPVVPDGSWIEIAANRNLKVRILKARIPEDGQAPPHSEYKPVIPVFEGTDPFVSLENDDSYIVQIRNDNPYAVAAQLNIDGLSMFNFSEEKDIRTDLWIFPPGYTYYLRGWHRRGNELFLFQISDYAGNSHYTGPPKDETKIGAISVTFYTAWKPNESPPNDEPIKDYLSRSTPQTIRGPISDMPNELVTYRTGRHRGTVTIRYRRPNIQ